MNTTILDIMLRLSYNDRRALYKGLNGKEYSGLQIPPWDKNETQPIMPYHHPLLPTIGRLCDDGLYNVPMFSQLN